MFIFQWDDVEEKGGREGREIGRGEGRGERGEGWEEMSVPRFIDLLRPLPLLHTAS